MGKMIIEIKGNIGDYEALQAVLSVVASGKISKNGTMYCYHTKFWNGTHVSAVERSKNSKSDKFIVYTDEYIQTKRLSS